MHTHSRVLNAMDPAIPITNPMVPTTIATIVGVELPRDRVTSARAAVTAQARGGNPKQRNPSGRLKTLAARSTSSQGIRVDGTDVKAAKSRVAAGAAIRISGPTFFAFT
jgi:hypothetical protein